MSQLESLPDEILQNIFEHFSILERLKYEIVCKRWHRLMPYQFREIDLVGSLIPKNRLKRADTFPLSSVLTTFLQRCGSILEKISFGKSNLLIPFTIITKIDEMCPKLEHLDLSFCTVTDQIVPALMNMAEKLISIDFGNTTFSIRSPRQHSDNMAILFANMRRLEKINLQRTDFHNLTAVGHLSENLKSINLNACSPLSPSILFELVIKLYDLEELRLSTYPSMNYAIVEAVCTLPKLKILDISRQSGEFSANGDQEAADWSKLRQVTSLEELYVQYNDNITDRVLESISRHCINLKILNVSYCRAISTFSTWLGRLNRLEAFYVSAHDAFSDFDVQVICEQNSTTLRIFHAPGCPQLTSQSLQALATCPNLVDLNLGECGAITDVRIEETNRFLEVLIDSCPNLENIDLRSGLIKDTLFGHILECSDGSKVLKKLKTLDISFCRHITDTGLKCLCEFFVLGGPRKEPVTIFVHQTRVTRAAVGEIDCNSARVQF